MSRLDIIPTTVISKENVHDSPLREDIDQVPESDICKYL